MTQTSLAGEESKTEKPRPPSSEQMVARELAVIEVQNELKAAVTPEEKKAVLEKFRAKSLALREQKTEGKSPQQQLDELKAKAEGNPELQAKLATVETRLKSVEIIKEKLAQAAKAEGDQKKALMEEVQREQGKLAKLQQAAMMERMREAQMQQQTAQSKNLSPEMAAIKAKSDARRREMSMLKESMKSASPEERTRLLEEFRNVLQQDRDERQAAMKEKNSQ